VVGDAPVVAPVLVGLAIVIAGQLVLPVYLLISHETRTPLVWLFGVTWAPGEFVLLMDGESGGLFALLVWVVGLLHRVSVFWSSRLVVNFSYGVSIRRIRFGPDLPLLSAVAF
jgi:hypothetical protein